MVVIPFVAMCGGSGDPRWDVDGLEAELLESELSGEHGLLPVVVLGDDRVGERVWFVRVREVMLCVGDGDGDSRSGGFWADVLRVLRAS